MRLRRTSTSNSNSNPSYVEVDSDEENYYNGQVDNSQESMSIHQISRRSNNRSTASKVSSCHSSKSEKSEAANDGRLTRSSRSRTSEQDPYSNQKRSRVDDRTVLPIEKRGRRSETSQEDSAKIEEVIDEEDDDEEDEEEEEEEEEEEDTSRKYSLRDRDSSRRETMNISVLGGNGGGYDRRPSHGLTRTLRSGEHVASVQPRLYLGAKIPNFAHARYRRSGNRSGKHDHHHHKGRHDGARRHYDSSSDSSSDDRNNSRRDLQGRGRHGGDHGGGSEDAQFNRYESERLQAERDSVQPLTMGSMGAGGGDTGMGGSLRDKASQRDMLRADAAPVAVDPRLGFQSIGGLEKHVQALKEMVVLPLLYPDVFQRFDTQPPRGVLFVGPPGTGKTLTARALANSVTMSAAQGGRKVSFFMRKGADCLSKWVGEGERQLRLLFEQAKRYQPSIIFFDEIDGLAPVR
jgi:ATPase family AAA domain-containing protein 2